MFEGLLQPTHLMLILAIAVVVFGPGKLPELGRGLGKSVRELRSAVGDVTAPLDEVKETVADVKDVATLNVKPTTKPTASNKATPR